MFKFEIVIVKIETMIMLEKIALLLVILFIFNSCPKAQKKQSNNFDFTKIDELIDKAITEKVFPGAVILIWKDGKVIHEKSFGRHTYEDNAPKVSKRTIFDLASLTKVVATTTATMICIDNKLFSLDDEVTKFIPEFGVNNKQNIKIRNLLLHNSGLVAWKKFYGQNLDSFDILSDIYNSELEYETGTKMVYSDLGVITLGKIIEKVTGLTLDKFCKLEIFTPLEMSSTFYNPNDSLKELCAPTEVDNYWRNTLIQGEVHDETAAMLGGVAGHAGLFSTANDLHKFLSMIMNGGIYKNKKIINSETIKLFTKKQSENYSRGLGWDTKSEKGSSAGNLFSSNSFGHTGFTGTSIWADPEKNIFVVFLTNRVYPSRENTKIISFRPKLHDLVIKSISE